MPVPHLEIRIVQRSKGKSAVAGAAYQAGEKLFSEYDQKWKNYTYKKEVVYLEIMLPPNAPPEYADRATLWNSAEEVEKQWNSQLARRFVVALPREVPLDMCPQMMQEYCREHFVSKGMCCDFAIHDPDPPGHNPHCHIMLTMRAIDENGKWMPKSRKVYDLDENGERIKLPSGRWKSHKEDTVDWNEQYHAEEWRHGWEVIQNKYLELAGSPERVDMRSYERQGVDMIPTVHMGAAVCALERKGIETNIGNLNRDTHHKRKETVKKTIREKSEEQMYRELEARCFRVLSDYFHLLRHWERAYAPKPEDETWHPLFVEALQKKDHIEYLLDVLLYDPIEERAALIKDYGKEVMKLERRLSELGTGAERELEDVGREPALPDPGGSQGTSGGER